MHNKDQCFYLAQKVGEDFSIKKSSVKNWCVDPLSANTHLCSSVMFSDPPHPGCGVPSLSQLTRQKSRRWLWWGGEAHSDSEVLKHSSPRRVSLTANNQAGHMAGHPGRTPGWKESIENRSGAPCVFILSGNTSSTYDWRDMNHKKWHFEVLVGVFQRTGWNKACCVPCCTTFLISYHKAARNETHFKER